MKKLCSKYQKKGQKVFKKIDIYIHYINYIIYVNKYSIVRC